MKRLTLFIIIVLIHLGTSLNNVTAQKLEMHEIGSIGLSDVTTTKSIDGKLVVPTLGEDEGILVLKLGPKLQAFLKQYGKNGQSELYIQLGRDIELITEKKSINFPLEYTFQVRIKGSYVGNQASSRPTIQLSGLENFSSYKDVIRLYKGQVNTATIEIAKEPIMNNDATLINELVKNSETKSVKSKRRTILWTFIIATVVGTVYILTQDGGSDGSQNFPLPPNRPNN